MRLCSTKREFDVDLTLIDGSSAHGVLFAPVAFPGDFSRDEVVGRSWEVLVLVLGERLDC